MAKVIDKDNRYLGNPLLKKSGVRYAFTKDEVDEYRKCRRSVRYFTENYFKIIHVDKGLIKYKPRKYQKKLIRIIHKNRFAIIKQCRQSGKTTTMTAYLLWYVLFNPDKIVGILANKGSTAREILGRVQLAYQHLPEFLQQGIVDFNKGFMHLENGSKIYAESTASDSIRGYSFSFIYIDECAHIPRYIWDEFYNSVYPTISSGKETRMILVSTPKGLNHFYKMWVDSEEKRNSFVNFSVDWRDVPGRDAEWKRETIANTSVEQFEQEQNCSFLGSSNTLISGSFLRTMAFKPPIFSNNNLDIYEAPQKENLYVLIADTAHGVKQDYSIFIVIDVTKSPYKIVAKYRSNEVSPYLFPDIIYKTATDYNECYVLVEINDIGGQIANSLYNDLEYTNILMCVFKGRNGQQISQGFGKNSYLGVKTTTQTKRVGCKIIKTLIENEKLIIEDLDIISELSTFIVKGGTYCADEGYHDDLAMTLVTFGWLTTQKFYKELSSVNMRKSMHNTQISQIESSLTPFGIINLGDLEDEPEIIAGSLDRWFRDEDDNDEPDGIYSICGY